MIYQLKVTLSNSEPPIWRRFVVDGQISLRDLHSVIQLVMGWTDSHLHHFIVDGTYYGLRDSELLDEGYGVLDEQRFTLAKVAPGAGGSFEYEYDFGDSWQHIIEVEGIGEPAADVAVPRCLEGERSCPPEDVGGIRGYQELLETLRDADHPKHTRNVEWIGDFDPERFDVQSVIISPPLGSASMAQRTRLSRAFRSHRSRSRSACCRSGNVDRDLLSAGDVHRQRRSGGRTYSGGGGQARP